VDKRDEEIVAAVADYIWDQMTEMRQYGLTCLEGALHMEDEVVRAEVRGISPKPVEFVTLTFKVGEADVRDTTQENLREDLVEPNV